MTMDDNTRYVFQDFVIGACIVLVVALIAGAAVYGCHETEQTKRDAYAVGLVEKPDPRGGNTYQKP